MYIIITLKIKLKVEMIINTTRDQIILQRKNIINFALPGYNCKGFLGGGGGAGGGAWAII